MEAAAWPTAASMTPRDTLLTQPLYLTVTLTTLSVVQACSDPIGGIFELAADKLILPAREPARKGTVVDSQASFSPHQGVYRVGGDWR